MTPDDSSDLRFELREGPLFLASVYRRIGSVPDWDDMRLELDEVLSTTPADRRVAREIGLNLWLTEFLMPPGVALLYEIREAERVVIYEALVPALD